jgi:hypothetical protein
MNHYYRKVLSFLDQYGITDAVISNGANHPKLKFSYHGTKHSLTLQGSKSAHETNILAMKKQDIRRLIGNHSDQLPSHEKRKLEDMMPEPFNNIPGLNNIKPIIQLDKSASIGRVACYYNSKTNTYNLRFAIPPNILVESGLLSNPYQIKITSEYDYEICKGRNGKRIKDDGRVSIQLKGNITAFGASKAEFVCVDGVILVHLPKENRVEISPEKSELMKLVNHERKPKELKIIQVIEPVTQIIPEKQSLTVLQPLINATYIKKILDQVKEIEKSTSYRILRTKDSDNLVFIAPRIE